MSRNVFTILALLLVHTCALKFMKHGLQLHIPLKMSSYILIWPFSVFYPTLHPKALGLCEQPASLAMTFAVLPALCSGLMIVFWTAVRSPVFPIILWFTDPLLTDNVKVQKTFVGVWTIMHLKCDTLCLRKKGKGLQLIFSEGFTLYI